MPFPSAGLAAAERRDAASVLPLRQLRLRLAHTCLG